MNAQSSAEIFHHPELDRIYQKIKISPSQPRTLKHRQLISVLQRLRREHPDVFQLTLLGKSVEGREIYLVTIGRGARTVMMWSQMHGNEPIATNALLDIFSYLLQNGDQPFVQDILQKTTLYFIPMLNPDGVEYDQRRNAQGIDLNRDARELATPEARILKATRDRLRPEFGFNLHDQNGRRTVGDTNKIVSIALLVPPIDAEETMTPAVLDAHRIASVMRSALTPFIDGHIARYDAGFMPRAFGENIQIAGTRTVLLESGGWYEDEAPFLVKMNFIAILEACHAIATESYQHADPDYYRSLPQNDQELFDLLVQNALIYDGIREQPFIGDIGINYTETPVADGFITRGRITDIGDMSAFTAKEIIDAEGMIVLPGLIGSVTDAKSQQILDGNNAQYYLKRGYTTLALPYRLHDQQPLRQIIAKLRHRDTALNLGFVVSLAELADFPVTEQATFLGDALFDGALAVVGNQEDCEHLHPLTLRIIAWLNRRQIGMNEFVSDKGWPELFAQRIFHATHRRAQALGLHERGQIRIGDFADLVIYRCADKTNLNCDQQPDYVLINGKIAFAKSASAKSTAAGTLLVR